MKRIPGSNKGIALEEVLRAFFLRAGFFVVRGVPYRLDDEDITDIDLWLYERPTGTARRVQICDVKAKAKPKAVERVFSTSGVAKALGVDGAYVATTDKRSSIRELCEMLGLQLIDGTDVRRIQSQRGLLYPGRITDEQMRAEIRLVDSENKVKTLQTERNEILTALAPGFGVASTVRVLEAFRRLAGWIVSYHPDSRATRAAARLAYLAAGVTAESLDYVSSGAAFGTLEEKREVILRAIRLGAFGGTGAQQVLEVALGLVRKYAPGGLSAAATLEARLTEELAGVPAEIVADEAITQLKANSLFDCGKQLESASYQASLPTFDQLEVASRSLVGALLDFSGIERERFATAWNAASREDVDEDAVEREFEDARQQEMVFGGGASAGIRSDSTEGIEGTHP